jgi:hypothetical protein
LVGLEGKLSTSRFFRAVAVAAVTCVLVLSTPAQALPRGFDPGQPIVRFVKYIKKIFTPTTHEDQPNPPKP